MHGTLWVGKMKKILQKDCKQWGKEQEDQMRGREREQERSEIGEDWEWKPSAVRISWNLWGQQLVRTPNNGRYGI